VGVTAADVVGLAVLRGVMHAQARGGIPSYMDLTRPAAP
jgi:hypothetical protein